MGAMEKLDGAERYIVTLEVLGPKDEAIAKLVNDAVANLKKAPINAVVKVSINGQKPHQNP
jgi:hypothetical protein